MAQSIQSSSSNHQKHLVQGLLSEIYHRYRVDQQLDSSTETSCLSDTTHAGHQAYSETLEELKKQQTRKLQKIFLENKPQAEVLAIKEELDQRVTVISSKLVRQLRQRCKLRDKHQKFCDMLTAILQAVSQKRRIDAKLNFSLEPSPGIQGFMQWRETLRAILRLPKGMPEQWRKKVWGYLSDNYIQQKTEKSWNVTLRHVFSERFNPDDDRLDNQIVKDLHRTGYTKMSGENSEEERMVLKRVLLAYARWNKEVGYCQGFNVLAALILEVTQNNAQLALKIMIYLVDGVLPESYFADNLRGLSVDMAVFRDLLRARLPDLSRHFDMLQRKANENAQSHCYEPPLTNVFTMQWFLTLFSTCLPMNTVLRIWDSVLLDGSEILLRVALAIWAKLGEKVGSAQSADEFYGAMAELTRQTLNGKFICADELMKTVYKIATFPFPRLKELREKYKYNITPFAADSDNSGNDDWRHRKRKDKYSSSHESTTTSESDPESQLERIPDNDGYEYYDDDSSAFACFGGHSSKLPRQRKSSRRSSDLKSASPGAFSSSTGSVNNSNGMMAERMSTDIAALKRQYMRICNRQLQSNYLIFAKSGGAQNKDTQGNRQVISLISGTPQAHSPVAMNHLLIGRQARTAQKQNGNAPKDAHQLPWKDAFFIQNLKSPNRIKPKPQKRLHNPNTKTRAHSEPNSPSADSNEVKSPEKSC